MTSEAQRRRGFKPPTPLDNGERWMMRLCFPADEAYRAALRKQVWHLGKLWAWQWSGVPGDTAAAEASYLWKNILVEDLVFSEVCYPMIIDIRMSDCLLQVKYETDPDTWVTLGDLSTCTIPGEKGDQGDPGIDGQDGQNGVDGQDGQDGQDGSPGAPGQDGTDGVDGADGQDGTDGTPAPPAIEQPTDPDEKLEQICGVATGLATYMVNKFKDAIDDAHNSYDDEKSIADAVGSVATLLGSVLGVAGVLGVATGVGIYNLISTLYADANFVDVIDAADTDFLEGIICDLYCFMKAANAPDFTEAIKAEWLDQVETDYTEAGVGAKFKEWVLSFDGHRLAQHAYVYQLERSAVCLLCAECSDEPPPSMWRIFAEGSADDSPNTTPWHLTAGFGCVFSEPYGFTSGATGFTQQTGSINDFGDGTVYHLLSIVADFAAHPTGTITVRGIRTVNNPSSGNHTFIIDTAMRNSTGWHNDTQQDISSTPLGTESDLCVLDFTIHFGALSPVDKIKIDIGSYAQYEVTDIVWTP